VPHGGDPSSSLPPCRSRGAKAVQRPDPERGEATPTGLPVSIMHGSTALRFGNAAARLAPPPPRAPPPEPRGCRRRRIGRMAPPAPPGPRPPPRVSLTRDHPLRRSPL
jgi:hypothetical protein